MKSFSDNELRGIITTDVMARGLDIPDVSHVFNFEIPEIQDNIFTELVEQVEQIKTELRFLLHTKRRRTFHRTGNVYEQGSEKIEFPEEVKVSEVKIASEKKFSEKNPCSSIKN